MRIGQTVNAWGSVLQINHRPLLGYKDQLGSLQHSRTTALEARLG